MIQKLQKQYDDELALQKIKELNRDVNSQMEDISDIENKEIKNSEFQNIISDIDLLDKDSDGMINRLKCLKNLAEHGEFHKQLRDIVEVGLRRYEDKYAVSADTESPFVLYEKYSRRDVSLLMNCGKDLSSTMYGMKRIDDDVFIFVTYHKTESDDEKEYVEGKPDYADAFEDNVIFS